MGRDAGAVGSDALPLTQWQRFKGLFQMKKAPTVSHKAVDGKLLQSPPEQVKLVSRMNSSTPSWLIQARAGVPDEQSNRAAWQAGIAATESCTAQAADQVASGSFAFSAPLHQHLQQQSVSVTEPAPLPPLRSVSAHVLHAPQAITPLRYRQQAYANSIDSEEMDTSSLLKRVGSSSMLDTRGLNGILLSARGILDTTTSSIMTPRAAMPAAVHRPGLALSSCPASTSSARPSLTVAPGLMKASARARSASLDSEPVQQPAIISPFAMQHQEESHEPSLCGLGGKRKARMALPAAPSTSTLHSGSHTAVQVTHQPLQSSQSAFQLGGMPVGQTEAGSIVKEAAAASPSQVMLLPPPAWASQSDHRCYKAPARSQSSASCSTDRSDSGELKRTGSTSASTSRTGSDASQQSMHDSVCSFEQRSLPAGKAKAQHNPAGSSTDASCTHSLACADMSTEDAFSDEQLLMMPRRGQEAQADSGLPDWIINPYQISFCCMSSGKLCSIGHGAFGMVYRGVFKGQDVAVKVCRHKTVNKQAMRLFQKEVSILHKCRHPNIVAFIGACTWRAGKRTVLVTTFHDKGDLYKALGRSPLHYDWVHGCGRSIALDVARGLAFLHSRNIVHFDLKSGNILLNRQHRAAIADVGLAKTLKTVHDNRLATFMATSDLGTFSWCAPEVLLGVACDAKADIYSFGVCLWEIATCEIPVGRDLRPIRVPDDGPQELRKLIGCCLDHDPAKRPTAQQLVNVLEAMQ